MQICHQCGALVNVGDRFCRSCGATQSAEASQDPLIGRNIGGSYTMQEVVGVGGMGRVYRAEQGTLGRTVAIKVIHPHLLGDEQTVARFYTEARAASRLNHPNSVSIIDFGRTDDGILYLAMEHLDGKDLAMVIHEDGPLPFSRVADILIAVLDALGEAHALDIVHRDLKPENIIIRQLRSGRDLVKVVDFGLATILSSGDTSITSPGSVCGTPDYMSPEQGRGDRVDGRGDLYSLGVMLFELLTDRLPFEDETPTKVVLRHLHDPVPNPAEAAPQRNIPQPLVDITMKALAKDPNDRFVDATEMQEALREVRAALRNRRTVTTCENCGESSAANMRFCGTCGYSLRSLNSMPARTPSRPSFAPSLPSNRPLIGRDIELAAILAFRAEHALGMMTHVALCGEHGVGKTRLIEEAAAKLMEAGDLVVGAKPHPTGAPIAYGAIRDLVCSLRGTTLQTLATLEPTHPLAKAGLQELLAPTGITGRPGESRAGAVACLLGESVEVTRAQLDVPAVVLVIDDLSRCDGLTQQVLTLLPEFVQNQGVMLLTADLQSRDSEGMTAKQLVLEGLPFSDADEFISGPGLGKRPVEEHSVDGRRYLPLYLEQLIALGIKLEDTTVPRLADLVAQRTDRLGVNARRVLQSISILGGTSTLGDLRKVSGKSFEGLEEAVRRGLIDLVETQAIIAHPFIGELVAAFTPAEVRRDLHRSALAVAHEDGAPLEVRAEHAFGTREPFTALAMLEKMGNACLDRGDATSSILAYQRALGVARREMLESGDVMMDNALFTFSQKLSLALERGGNLPGADGVLREALDLTAPRSIERVRMYMALARIASKRDRKREALRQLGLALDQLDTEQHPKVEAQIQMLLGGVRADDTDLSAAVSAYRRALELFNSTDLPLEATQAAIEFAAVLIKSGDKEAAAGRLIMAERSARDLNAPALEAIAVGMQGELTRGRARSKLLNAAAELSAKAGDSGGFRKWSDQGEKTRSKL